MPKKSPPWRVLMLSAPLLLVLGCASAPQPLPPVVVAPPAIPPLPSQARQPQAPAICSPTCLVQWRRQVELWQKRLTGEE